MNVHAFTKHPHFCKFASCIKNLRLRAATRTGAEVTKYNVNTTLPDDDDDYFLSDR